MTAEELLRSIGLLDPAAQLGDFVQRQRWFGGRGEDLSAVRVEDAAVLRDGERQLVDVLLRMGRGDDDDDRYHVPLLVRPLAADESLAAETEGLVAVGVRDENPIAVYDAAVDPHAMYALWEAIAAGEGWPSVAGGDLRCRSLGLAAGEDGPSTIHALGREQSNTSLVRGDRELLKIYRRVESGLSPELELTEALAAAGFTQLAAPLGVIEYRGAGAAEATLLVMVQPFLHNATEGWALALGSLRDLYADSEERGASDDTERRQAVLDQGASFVPEAARLGEMTAQMHLTLASERMPEAMRARPVTVADLQGWADDITRELDALLQRDEPAVQTLRHGRDALLHVVDAIRTLDDVGLATRFHGDYHLGQVVRTDAGWVVLDFEGEPSRPLRQRREHSSPLRDVAGMLRSFDYAAAVALAERCAPGTDAWQELMLQGDAWSQTSRDAFWAAYTARTAGTGVLPSGDAATVLRRAFEVRKAVYEVVYELGHRPSWVGFPLRFLEGLAS